MEGRRLCNMKAALLSHQPCVSLCFPELCLSAKIPQSRSLRSAGICHFYFASQAAVSISGSSSALTNCLFVFKELVIKTHKNQGYNIARALACFCLAPARGKRCNSPDNLIENDPSAGAFLGDPGTEAMLVVCLTLPLLWPRLLRVAAKIGVVIS